MNITHHLSSYIIISVCMSSMRPPPVRSTFQVEYEAKHCPVQCRKYTPCLMVDSRSTVVDEAAYCAYTDRATPHMQHAAFVFSRCDRRHPAGKLEQLRHTLNRTWSGSTLLITGPVADGFWVRVLTVLAHAQYARQAKLRISVAFSSPVDPYDQSTWRAPSKAGLQRELVRRDGWTQYFESIGAPTQPSNQSSLTLQLGCAASARAWEQHSNYATTFAEASRQRAVRSSLVATLPIRPRREYLEQVNADAHTKTIMPQAHAHGWSLQEMPVSPSIHGLAQHHPRP